MIFLLPLPHPGRLYEVQQQPQCPRAVPSPAGICARSHDWAPHCTEKNMPDVQWCPRREGRGLRESHRGDAKVCSWRRSVSSWLCPWQLNASASTSEQFSVRSLRTTSGTAQTESTYAALAWFQLIHREPFRSAPTAASLPALCQLRPCTFISLILLAGIVWFARYSANSFSRDKVHVISYIKMLTHMMQLVYLLSHLLIITGNCYQSRGWPRVPTECCLGKGDIGRGTT